MRPENGTQVRATVDNGGETPQIKTAPVTPTYGDPIHAGSSRPSILFDFATVTLTRNRHLFCLMHIYFLE